MSATSNLRHSQTARPSSPHTPQQPLRSANTSFASASSPGSSFRNEDDAIIFEIGARWLRAGFEGNGTPRFGPEEMRRAADYRGWINGDIGAGPLPKPVNAEDWVRDYELWQPDLSEIDLGLVEDKIERVFRETYNQYLLTDAGTSRLVLALPALMPHPLLSSLLSILFSRWRFPSVTLLPSATMSATAAGLRSALVVDLGWAETTVTGIYEYREAVTKRSTRAMRALMLETGRFLTRLASGNDDAQEESSDADISVGFAYCEEVHEYQDLPLSDMAKSVEKVILASQIPECDLDDEEKSIPLLVYNSLLSLSPDARGTCMARIVFVGGGARIPGLRQRILKEVQLLIDRHGWSPIRGKVVERQRQRLEELKIASQTNTPSQSPDGNISGTTDDEKEKSDPSKEEPEVDFVDQKLRRQNKDIPVPVTGILREIESLGPWAGASLVTSLKIRGMVEIEREKFLQYGLAGATRDLEQPVPDRRSGLRAGDRSSWTLAGWA
ncbi:hypothetical protein N7533_007209 [Penicillium manginii]|uniref:uncharacterized protein n=1 Tax=Penicillium manginii TaxID=203109 RepID=UPI002547815B|nr:uncharacterized protein N7533_007209 [Penicillium manginii]KAJ5750181.1 hypothetical protein N7533_007209 [Penicillium manginii]